MFPFEYDRPTQQERVIDALSHSNRTKILAGGTNLAGSMTTASVVPAVQAAATQLKAKLQGRSANFDSNAGVIIEAVARVEPDEMLKQKASAHSFGAVFAEVAVDSDLGTVKVRRIVAVYDVGRIINEQTARSQFIGGIVSGISLALHENTLVEAHRTRRQWESVGVSRARQCRYRGNRCLGVEYAGYGFQLRRSAGYRRNRYYRHGSGCLQCRVSRHRHSRPRPSDHSR